MSNPLCNRRNCRSHAPPPHSLYTFALFYPSFPDISTHFTHFHPFSPIFTHFHTKFTHNHRNLPKYATHLQAQLNAIDGKNNTYLVAVDPATDRLTVSLTAGSTAFSFLFATGNFVDLYDVNNVLIMINSPARILGFLANDYASSALSITAPNGMDVSLLTNRIYLYVNHDNSQDLGTIERSIGKQSPHAVLYMNTPTLDYKSFTTEVFEPLFRSSPAPIARLLTLDIALRDEFDRLVELNGRDFTLLLEIEYLE